MSRIVQKFGGTSVGDVERIRRAAQHVKAEVDRGEQIAVVVSAMADTTDDLATRVNAINPMHDAREYDVVVSSGELVSCGLLALALQDLGIQARSWLAWQLPIETDGAHGRARIRNVGVEEISRRMTGGEVPVIPGFQGITPDGRIATLGRGGSDTTAVALAVALEADCCDIYTDVDGVYTADPDIVAGAQKLGRVTYEEMLEMASLGTRVLHTRAVELAMGHGVPLHVRSSFDGGDGTLVVDEDQIVEQQIVNGIAYSRDEARLTIVGVPDRPGIAAAIFGPLAEASVSVDMIVQSTTTDGALADITFTLGKADFDHAIHLLEEAQSTIGYSEIISDRNVVKVSVIGVGMRSHAGVAQKMFSTLSEKSINIQVISTSEIKTSVLIAEEYAELAIRALHTAYDLDAA